MKSLVIIAHGSKRQESNDEIRTLVHKVQGLPNDFSEIIAAFLELAEPLIPDAIRQAIKNGATHIYVMPYFLSAGKHVTRDIPADIKIVQEEYPNIRITLLPYIGMAEIMPHLLIEQTNQHIKKSTEK